MAHGRKQELAETHSEVLSRTCEKLAEVCKDWSPQHWLEVQVGLGDLSHTLKGSDPVRFFFREQGKKKKSKDMRKLASLKEP